jgi:curved DNA-binding protein CbpA
MVGSHSLRFAGTGEISGGRSLSFDPYATLQVAPDAGDDIIAAAYRALARRHHPDLAGEGATRSMAAINAAWELIGSPEARAAFDRSNRARLVATGPGHRGGAASSGSRAVRPGASRWSAGSDGSGAAGPPPGRPSGSVLPFGRHIGWSLGEIARVDPGYLEWLEERAQGRPYLDEIDVVLRRLGRRPEPAVPAGRGRRSR